MVDEPLTIDNARTYGACDCGAPLTLSHTCYHWPPRVVAGKPFAKFVLVPVAYLQDLHERWQFLMAFYQGRMEREAGERAWRADLEELQRATRAYRDAAAACLRSPGHSTAGAQARLELYQAQDRLFEALEALEASHG